MTHKKSRKKRCKRVPFVPNAFLRESGSFEHLCDHFSLPENGTIHLGRSSLPERTIGSRSERAAFCVFSRASITVEAAIALPLFFLCIVCLISIMNVYGRTLKQDFILRDTAMAAALAAGGGEEERFIDLNVPYSFRPFYLPEGAFSKLIPCRAVVRAWNGRDEASAAEGKVSGSEYVYVTEHESVYHTSAGCTHLDLSVKEVSQRTAMHSHNEYGARYHACERCAAAGVGGNVYITPYGDCYHASADCAGLTRTVRMVEKDSLDRMLCECSRCRKAAA